MANEITVSALLKLENGKDKYPGDKTQYSVTQATTRPANLVATGSVNVSADAALTIPGIAAGNYGWVLLYNLDTTTTKYIDFGPASGGACIPCVRLYGSGPPALVRLIPSTSYRVVASTGTQVLQIVAFAL